MEKFRGKVTAGKSSPVDLNRKKKKKKKNYIICSNKCKVRQIYMNRKLQHKSGIIQIQRSFTHYRAKWWVWFLCPTIPHVWTKPHVKYWSASVHVCELLVSLGNSLINSLLMEMNSSLSHREEHRLFERRASDVSKSI